MNSTDIAPSSRVDTSAGARAAIGLVKEKSQADLIYDIVRSHCLNGGGDMSMREIQQAFHARFERWLDVSSISARVNVLVTAKRLYRSSAVRKCTITAVDIHPLFVMATQDRLVD